MENTLMTREQSTTDAFLRECAMAGEIKRLRADNAAYAARINRERAARMARYRREIEAEKHQELRGVLFLRGAALFLAGAGVAALMVAIAIMVVGG